MNCKHASHLISQAQDRPLSWGQQFALRFHLLLCDACTQFSRQLTLLREAVRQTSRHIERDEHLKLSQDAHRRIAGTLQSHRRAIDEARRNPGQHYTD